MSAITTVCSVRTEKLHSWARVGINLLSGRMLSDLAKLQEAD